MFANLTILSAVLDVIVSWSYFFQTMYTSSKAHMRGWYIGWMSDIFCLTYASWLSLFFFMQDCRKSLLWHRVKCFEWKTYFIQWYDSWMFLHMLLSSTNVYNTLNNLYSTSCMWLIPPTGFICGSQANVTNDFSLIIQIWWKSCFAKFRFLTTQSLQIFAHDMAAVLPCHVQNLIVIALLESGWEQGTYLMKYKWWWQNGRWYGPLFSSTSIYTHKIPP